MKIKEFLQNSTPYLIFAVAVVLVGVILYYLYKLLFVSKKSETFTSEIVNPLQEENPTQILLFYAPWCGHCKDLKKDVWPKIVNKYKNRSDVKITEINGDESKNKQLMEKYGVKGYPTIIGINKESQEKEFNGSRDVKSISEFIENV